MGYSGFKIHGWGGSDQSRNLDREIEMVHAVGERIGAEVDLMCDLACEYETFADALQVGEACDKQDFFWYEDPYRDGSISQHAHRRLSERLDTLILRLSTLAAWNLQSTSCGPIRSTTPGSPAR